MVQMRFPKGKVIQERYIVEEMLGKGGFGAVYRVRDRRVKGNVFALKEVLDPDARQRASFSFEGELLKRLDHRALPRVYRVFEDQKNNRLYMLMDYIDGPNLERLRHQQPEQRFPLARVLEIMAPIIDAVSYLHAQFPPILHRDIKPANIIVPADGDDAVLVDFGIAKEYNQEGTTTALRHCSPGYGAPEHYTGGTTTRTDVYSLGATFYTLLTGDVPVDALQRMTQLSARGADPLVRANMLAPEIPDAIAGALQRAMAIDSRDRFATVAEFWQALKASAIAEEQPAPYMEQPEEAAPAPAPVVPAPVVVVHKEPRIYREPLMRSARNARAFPLAFVIFAIIALVSGGLFGLNVWYGTGANHSAKIGVAPLALTRISAASHNTAIPVPSPVVSPSPTPAAPAQVFPDLAVSYGGKIHNIPADVSSSLTLQIQQTGATIVGYLKLGPGLLGSGNFSGTVFVDDRIEFLVPTSGKILPLFFQGQIQADGSLSGEYCSYQYGQCDYSGGGYGTWSVQPLSSRSNAPVSARSPSNIRIARPTGQEEQQDRQLAGDRTSCNAGCISGV